MDAERSRGCRARTALVALAVSLTVAACSTATEQSTPSGGSAPGATAGSRGSAALAATDGPCAWAVRADKATQNIAYPDTAATYWATAYNLGPGEQIELQGTYPAARYASFVTYQPTGGAVDVIADRDIQPDAGSRNPFAAGRGAGEQSYRLVITGDGSTPDRPNVLRARVDEPTGTAGTAPTSATAPSGSATTSTVVDRAIANLLGGGGTEAVGGTVIYRVYAPDDPSDPAAGVGLPHASVIRADGTRQPIATCATSGPSARAIQIIDTYGPSTDRPAPAQPIFIRPAATSANLYPNPDNIYLATITEHRPGRVVVVRGKAPTFPDPARGRPIRDDDQVRYWSLCTNEWRKPYPVSACAIDREVALDGDGRYTFVISTPADRPASATTDRGVTWLDWGSTDVNSVLLFRHMLANPDIPTSAFRLATGALVDPMGDYAPRGKYCTTASFDRDGASECVES